jgi:calcium-dependent protein kinase
MARAVKTVKKRNFRDEELVRREVAILRRLDHPCICRLLETFEDKQHIYLVLELIDGRELFDEIAEQQELNEVRTAGIMQQVFGALQYCHEQKVIHRDLKPENIMVRRSATGTPSSNFGTSTQQNIPEIVLIDFGMSMMCDGDSPSGAAGSSVMGTSDYMAPEALRGRAMAASDVWSAGMVLHALLVGYLPSSKQLLGYESLTSGRSWEEVSRPARDLVTDLLQVDPAGRLTAARAAGHVWTRGAVSAALHPKQVNSMMQNFMSFHRSAKLKQAALTALAMQHMNQHLSGQREQFIAMDSDGNGRISKQEFINSIASASCLPPHEVHRWESVFDSIDTDGSQEIDYTEWLAAAMHEVASRSEQTLQAAFRVFDADGDGRIDESEFTRVLRLCPDQVAAMLPKFDVNGDGVIDFEEFKHLLNVGAPTSPASRPVMSFTV